MGEWLPALLAGSTPLFQNRPFSSWLFFLFFPYSLLNENQTLLIMKTNLSLRLLLPMVGLLAFSPVLSQNYNAGPGSGTGGSGTNNVFVGPNAGPANTTGSHNSFIGSSTGRQNTTGNKNTFLGSNAGYSNSGSSASGNSFVGSQSGYNNIGGWNNSFLGGDAGFNNTTGYENTFVGNGSGYNNTIGTGNSFLGTRAGNSNTTGRENSFVGLRAGYLNTTGNQNSTLGYYAGYNNTTGGSNSFMGASAGRQNTTGSSNSFLGAGAGSSNTTGSNNLLLGSFANPSTGALSNAGAIGSQAYVSASNSLVLGSISGVNGAMASTKVGIGTTAPSYLLHVNGDAAKPGGGSWTVASDQRLKKNVSAFTQGLEVLTKVKPVWFQYNGEAGMPTNKTYVGVIAQEMQQIAPYMVGSFTYQDTTGKKAEYLDYDANALTYILVNAVKEQQGQMEQLKQEKDTQIEQLKQENEQMKKEMAEIRALLLDKKPVAESDAAARLWQNEPNPTGGTTLIRYRIPRQASQARINLYSVKGEELKSFPIRERGEGQLSLDTATLPEGIYLYRLVIDGKQIDAKKLLLNR